jgi:hypothetical protein
LNINLKAIKEGDWKNFDMSLSVDGAATAGISAEGDILIRFGGSEGSVKDLSGVKLFGEDGAPVNVGGCVSGGCVSANATFNGKAKNGMASSILYGIGGGTGVGVDIGADIIQVSDNGFYGRLGDEDSSERIIQVPIFNPDFRDKFIEKLTPLIQPRDLIHPQ